jgi:hypothetical protein
MPTMMRRNGDDDAHQPEDDAHQPENDPRACGMAEGLTLPSPAPEATLDFPAIVMAIPGLDPGD